MSERRNEFGEFLRARRLEKELSLREVAQHLEVSHVFVNEVERGVRPLPEKHWSKLGEILELSHDQLKRQLSMDRPIEISLENATPKYRDLGLALARRIERQDISQRDLSVLLRILGDKDE